MKDYWSIRAQNYNKLQWATNKILLQKLINFAKLRKQDKVIDVGCGTGVLANLLVDKVEQVYAIDKSEEMLIQSKFNPEIYYRQWDLEDYFYIDNHFDKAIARMVFHHIDNLEKAFKVCYDLLVKSGWFIIEEGISPSENPKVRKWYSDVMGLKEKRHCFSIRQLKKLYLKAGFKNIKTKEIINKNFSINNWLSSSGQDKKVLKEIYDLHLNAPKFIKDIYKMVNKNGEINVQTKILFIKGQK